MITFDPRKEQANVEKHGISLSRAGDMEIAAVIEDDRKDYGEKRYRAFGFLDGVAHCLAFTVREGAVRAISLRRAHAKELKRYVEQTQKAGG